MLDFHANRLDYGALLCPPAGYVLDRAIATTYSLDLNALLAIPVALFYAHTLEGELNGERLALLEAVRRLSDKVTLFHQAGKVRVPTKYNRLYAFLEDCLVPVSPLDPWQSFHPKVWVLRFTPERKGEPIRFRLLVLSRNLTFDRSWDLAVNLEGEVTGKEQPENHPLIDFVGYLLNQNKQKFQWGRAFKQQLKKVVFCAPSGFNKLLFHPIGIPGYTSGVPNYNPEHLVILSPFVQDAPLQGFRTKELQEAYLFSRWEELNGLQESSLSTPFRCYHLNRTVVDGERALDMAGEQSSQDLHAKLFVQTRKGHSRWLLGSANATNPADGARNVEFMLELSGYGAAIQGPSLVDTFLGEDRKKGVFVEYERPESISTDSVGETLRQQLRVLENRLVLSGLSGTLVQSQNGTNHDLIVKTDLKTDDMGFFRIELFPPGQERLARSLPRHPDASVCFENLALVDLSRFMAIKIGHPDLYEERRFLLRMDIDLPEERLSRIFSLLLKNQERFFEYLRFLLAQNPDKESFMSSGEGRRDGAKDPSSLEAMGAVYEDLLIAASRCPGKLKAVESVIQRLQKEPTGKEIIPQEFLKLWEYFKGYATDA